MIATEPTTATAAATARDQRRHMHGPTGPEEGSVPSKATQPRGHAIYGSIGEGAPIRPLLGPY